jgi:hypothetical protein
VANPLPLVGLAGDDLVTTGGISMSNQDSEFPATNGQSNNPAKLAKSTTNTTTVTVTHANLAIVAAAVIQTNAETITVKGASVTVPSVTADGQRVHPWLDRRTSPFTASTSSAIVLSKASGVVWFGRIVLLVAIHELNPVYNWTVGEVRQGEVVIPTRLGSINQHTQEIRTRWAEGQVTLLEDEALMASINRSAKGSNRGHLLIPDEAVNDAWFVRSVTPYQKGYPDIDVRVTPIRFEELSTGPING